MALEYRIYHVSTEVASAGDPLGAIQFYHLSAEVAHDGVLGPVQFYHVDTEVVSSGLALNTIQMYAVSLEIIRDLRDKFTPAFVSDPDTIFGGFGFTAPYTWALIGAGDDELHAGFSFVQDPITVEDRERNPYSAHLDRDVVPFVEQQQRIIRDQHNRTQAGDSTFDYGLLLKGTPDQLYTLGSLGRFYHDRYGIIIARYVQFQSCVETMTQGAPVGYLGTSYRVDWVVTNDYSLSGPNRGLGVMCLADVPADGSYGWIVVEGAIPVLMQQLVGIWKAAETEYVWAGTGLVHFDHPGTIIARKWGNQPGPLLEPGTLFARVGGLSHAWDREQWLPEFLDPITDSIVALDTRLDAAETTITSLSATSALHTQQIATLDQRITQESQTRARDIAAIRLEVGAVDWSVAIAAGDNAVREEFRVADEALSVRIAAAEYTANMALAAVSGIDGGSLNLRLDGLDAQVANLNLRLENFTVVNPSPVAGSVLMQMVSGTVYTFEPVAFILENLADVDTTTTPPVDDDVLTWVAANSAWEPKAPSGGPGGTPDPSWANGMVERRPFITVTVTGSYSGNPHASLAAIASNNFFFGGTAGTQTLTFLFPAANRVTAIGIAQDVATAQGTWDIEGSNDGVSWTSLTTGIAWAPVLTNMIYWQAMPFTNANQYLYYRLNKTSGSTSSTPYVSWFAFKCEPL